jgi:serine O-acetyltransferase
MGEGCSVFHEVTVGPTGIRSMEYPVIGDRVMIFPGAKVLGAITIGDDAVIGASSLVVEDVPAGAVVSGNPARVIRMADEDE